MEEQAKAGSLALSGSNNYSGLGTGIVPGRMPVL